MPTKDSQIGTGEFLRAASRDLQTIARHRGQYDAHRYRYDTILIVADEPIEAFERAEEPNYLHAGVTNF